MKAPEKRVRTCRVYRSEKRAETYLYLAEERGFEDLPDELRRMFGEAVAVMRLELTPESKLARVETLTVLDSLDEQGFYLQLPPRIPVEEEISRRFS